MKKNGVFLFVISHLVPEIFKIFVLCKLGTDDAIRCDNMESQSQSQSICNAHIALALLINLQEVDSVFSRSNTGVTIPA